MQVPSLLPKLAYTPLAIALWLFTALVLAWTRITRRPGDARRALMVSWEFPPCAATGVHLPASIVRHATEAGWDMQVVCGPGPARATTAGLELAAAVPDTVRIARVSRVLARERYARFHPAWSIPSIDGGFLTAQTMILTAALAFRDRPPAVIIASGPRFANFAAARRLAEAFGAKLLLQYRDEWTVQTPDFVTVTRHDQEEERRCLARADVVSFVSEGKRSAYVRAFPELDATKFITTPNGWEPYFHARAMEGTQHLPAAAGTFRLTYTGRYHRSFARLLSSCETLLARRPDLGNLRLVFVGEQLPQNQALMADFAKRNPNVLIDLPSTPPTTAIEIQRESSALLLVNDHSYEGVIPLKTFDYMCSAQPILVFGRTGGAASIVDTMDAGISVPVDDTDAFEAAIARLMTGNRPWDTPARQKWCARHNRRALVMEMLEAVTKAPHLEVPRLEAPRQ
jgi:glycosyltransferase involved in cell wall biosynthesis